MEQDLLTFLNTNKPPHLRIFIYHRTKQPETTFPVTSLFASHINDEWLAPSSVNDNPVFSLSDNETTSFLDGLQTQYLYQVIPMPAAAMSQMPATWRDTSITVDYNIPTFFIIVYDDSDENNLPKLIGVIERPYEDIHQLVTSDQMIDMVINPESQHLYLQSHSNSSSSNTSFDPTALLTFTLGESKIYREGKGGNDYLINFNWPDTIPEGPLTPNICLTTGADPNLQYGFAYHKTTDAFEIILLDDNFNRLPATIYVQGGSYTLNTPHFYYDDHVGSGEGVVIRCNIKTTIYDGLFLYKPKEE